MKAEEEERRKRDQEKLRKETRSLRDKGERPDKKEQQAMDEMQTADELLSEGTSKLQAPLSSGSKVDSQGAKVACLMIETAKSNQAKAQTQTIRSCWRKLYQRMFLLYHQRRESQSKCKLSFYISKHVLCELSKEKILLC